MRLMVEEIEDQTEVDFIDQEVNLKNELVTNLFACVVIYDTFGKISFYRKSIVSGDEMNDEKKAKCS